MQGILFWKINHFNAPGDDVRQTNTHHYYKTITLKAEHWNL